MKYMLKWNISTSSKRNGDIFWGIFQNDEEKGEKMGENQMSSKGICRIILIRYNEIECKLR